MILFPDSSLLTEKAVHPVDNRKKVGNHISLHELCWVCSNKLKSRPLGVGLLVWCLVSDMSQSNNNLSGSEMYSTLNRDTNPGLQGHASLVFALYAFDPAFQILPSVAERFKHSTPFNLVCWSKKLILRSPTSSPSAFTNRLFIKVMQLRCLSFRHINVLFDLAFYLSVD